MGLIRYSEAWGNWFIKKNLKSKISWHCLFKHFRKSLNSISPGILCWFSLTVTYLISVDLIWFCFYGLFSQATIKWKLVGTPGRKEYCLKYISYILYITCIYTVTRRSAEFRHPARMTQDSSCWVGENDCFIWAGNLRPQVPKFSVITGNFRRFLLWKKEECAWWDRTQFLWTTIPVLYP